jgi:hypothetical protein
MPNKNKLLLLLATAGTLSLADDDKLGFVFQMVRHGARAPLIAEPANVFKVPSQYLTASGMRQRFLLGTSNHRKYIDHYGLLDTTFNPNQIYAQSTDIHRVLQSTYSEFMGLYPPSNSTQDTLSKGELKSLNSDKGMPSLRVRNAEAHKAKA